MTSLAFLDQATAKALDAELMSETGGGFFTSPQLMELAGLACANVVQQIYSPKKALILVGPGNNGGDALVCARHLFHAGVECTLIRPKQANDNHCQLLEKQCTVALGQQLLENVDSLDLSQFDVAVDGLFGFSFAAERGLRAPFDALVSAINAQDSLPVVALDVPTGWPVNDDIDVNPAQKLRADSLISLTAPKLCARSFSGRHFLGGRFVPPSLAEKYKLNLPEYPGTAQFIELTK